MKIPVFLAVAQWALLLSLGWLVVIMYRQLGRVFGEQKTSPDHGPSIGSSAPAIEYMRLADDTPGYLTPGSQPTLVAFVEPSCLSCDRLVAAMSAVHVAGELDDWQVLLLMSDPPKYLRVSEAFRSTRLEIGRVLTRATVDDYHAMATPLLVAIDVSGVVRAAGAAVEISEVRSYIETCRLSSREAALTVAGSVAEGANLDAAVAAAVSHKQQAGE